MDSSFNHIQLKQLKQVVKDVLDEEMPNRLDNIENKIDRVLKIVTDTKQELVLTQSKVDNLEVRISTLESNFATA